ncbi:predicted protein [Nematostella vectensis]|uniref:SCP domain-containing protein n=1 Tax=Nematostella vectensis TaxID=45351 RepID=A7SLZ5_NEMVE|nr:predicted protein [Nematostella vectensis]|eukprot:XP_001627387.1 predicted protein [Nematostella vectensis]
MTMRLHGITLLLVLVMYNTTQGKTATGVSKNSARSVLEGITPDELRPKASDGNVNIAGGASHLFNLSPKDVAAVSDFMKDVDKNRGVLTPDLMKQMANLEELPQAPSNSQGYERNLGISDSVGMSPQYNVPDRGETDTRTYQDSELPFKVNDEKAYKSNENTGEQTDRYLNDPLPEYHYKETTYDVPSESENTVGYVNHGYGRAGDKEPDLVKQYNSEYGEESVDPEGLADSLQDKKAAEDRLVNELGRKVLWNILSQKHAEETEVGGSKTQNGVLNEGENASNEAAPTVQNNGPVTTTQGDGLTHFAASIARLTGKDDSNAEFKPQVSQDAQILLDTKLNDESKEAPTNKPDTAVIGKLNNKLQEAVKLLVPTLKVSGILNPPRPSEKVRIVVPGAAIADSKAAISQNVNKNEDKDKDDTVTLKISGKGKPVSFNADASKDGSILLKIPKKFSEDLIEDVESKKKKAESKKQMPRPKEEEEDEDDADSRDLKGKHLPRLSSGNSPTISSWVISGKKNDVTTERPTTPAITEVPNDANANPLENANLGQIAGLTQALWAGELAKMNQNGGENALPYAYSSENSNMQQLMSLLSNRPGAQVGNPMHDGKGSASYGSGGHVGGIPLATLLQSSRLMEATGIARNKGMPGKPSQKPEELNLWSPCSVTCGHGIQARARPCQGHECSGFQTESRKCYQGPCPEEIAKAGLKLHNQFRRWHKTPSLKWSDKLAKKAQKLAQSMAADSNHTDDEAYSQNELPGENIAVFKHDYDIAAERATRKWYEEVEGYRFGSPVLGEATKHFSQLVWKGTKSVGIGVARGARDRTYVVALYDPPGNVEGAEKDNIHTPDDAPS